VFGSERVGGLGDERGGVEARRLPERGDDGEVDAADADGGVAQVDDDMAYRVQAGKRGADGDGLAGPDLSGDHAERAFGDRPGDAGDSLVVGSVAV
jgi:hypothetical protein